MKEWLIAGILVGTINIPINYLTRQFFIISSSDYYFLISLTKCCFATTVFLFTYDSLCVNYLGAMCIGVISGVQKYLYINTRDVSNINPQYVERISTMLIDSSIWDTWNAMCFGGGTIIVMAVLIIDNATMSRWFITEQQHDDLPLYENLITQPRYNNERNNQYVGSILLKSIEYIALKIIIYYNEHSLACMTSIIFFYTIGDMIVFTIIKVSMDGYFILDKYSPVENIRNKFFMIVVISCLEILYELGLIYILTFKQNIGYALIIIDTYRIMEESILCYYDVNNDLTQELTKIGLILYIYGSLFFYPTFIFLN